MPSRHAAVDPQDAQRLGDGPLAWKLYALPWRVCNKAGEGWLCLASVGLGD
jgi:hypothetical protein